MALVGGGLKGHEVVFVAMVVGKAVLEHIGRAFDLVDRDAVVVRGAGVPC